MLLGAKSAGKSSSGNIILGREVFEAEGGTALCVEAEETIAERKITVVDTPGWWPNVSLEDSPGLIKREVAFSVSLCTPGPHVFLLIMRLDEPFSDAEKGATMQYLNLLS